MNTTPNPDVPSDAGTTFADIVRQHRDVILASTTIALTDIGLAAQFDAAPMGKFSADDICRRLDELLDTTLETETRKYIGSYIRSCVGTSSWAAQHNKTTMKRLQIVKLIDPGIYQLSDDAPERLAPLVEAVLAGRCKAPTKAMLEVDTKAIDEDAVERGRAAFAKLLGR